MLKKFVVVFLAAMLLYFVLYYWIEHRRASRGPWRVTFTRATSGLPALVIEQAALGITNLQVVFLGQTLPTNLANRLTFGSPREVPYAVPFGTCVFEDLTFLPGAVTFSMFGHEIELLPRVLIVDRQEHRWIPNASVHVEPVKSGGK